MRVFWDEVMLGHRPRFFLQRGVVRENFEVPARAEALLEGVRSLGLKTEAPAVAAEAALEAVHPVPYLEFLRGAHAAWSALEGAGPEVVANMHPTPEMLAQGARTGPGPVGQAGWYMADTACPVGEGTWVAARRAADAAIAAADEAAAGRDAYALVRPPGHHAYAARAGGHCYLNNAAMAAARLRAGGAARVAVVDIDSHHGNGTQGIFWERGDVLTVSVHGDPTGYYPWFIGHAGERGAGAGEGANVNIPLARGTGDEGWFAAIAHGLEVVRRFGAEAIVVSLGFDASEHEPLGFLAVSAEGFARAGQALAGLGRPCAIVQEGGYDTARLGALLARFLGGFAR